MTGSNTKFFKRFWAFLWALIGLSAMAFSSAASGQQIRPLSIALYIKKPGIDDSSSFCYVHRDKDLIEGQNVQTKVKIASVSKLFTSYYVLKTLGPQHRFQTRFSYDKQTRDLYVYGSRDPFMGLRSLQFIVSELNKLGIKDVRNFYFDQKFSVYLDVEVRGPTMWSDSKMPAEVRYHGRSQQGTRVDLRRFLAQMKLNYASLKAATSSRGTPMTNSLQFRVKEFIPMDTEILSAKKFDVTYEYVSAPLLHYVKDLNVHSNNYVADELIAALGGIEKFNQFFVKEFGFTGDDFELYTGSGLWRNSPEVRGSGKARTGFAKDNLATCEAVMNVLFGLNRLMQKFGLEMSDIVMVPSQDPGSLTRFKIYKSDELKNAVLAKTGTLDQAASLAGEISSESGEYFFGIFFETTNHNATTRAAGYRDQILRQLMKDIGGGKDPIAYTPQQFFPFDSNSVLRPVENAVIGSLP